MMSETLPIPWLSSRTFRRGLAACKASCGTAATDTAAAFLTWYAWWEDHQAWVAHWTNPVALVLMGGDRRAHALPDFYVFDRKDAIRVSRFAAYCLHVASGLDPGPYGTEWAATEKQPPTHCVSPDCETLGAGVDGAGGLEAGVDRSHPPPDGSAILGDEPTTPLPAIHPDRLALEWRTYSPAGRSLTPYDTVVGVTIAWDTVARRMLRTEFTVDSMRERHTSPLQDVFTWVAGRLGGEDEVVARRTLGDEEVGGGGPLNLKPLHNPVIQRRVYKGFPDV